eukprot:286271-Amphidinium_carterae.1
MKHAHVDWQRETSTGIPSRQDCPGLLRSATLDQRRLTSTCCACNADTPSLSMCTSSDLQLSLHSRLHYVKNYFEKRFQTHHHCARVRVATRITSSTLSPFSVLSPRAPPPMHTAAMNE